jgi:molybdate transport system permease protein
LLAALAAAVLLVPLLALVWRSEAGAFAALPTGEVLDAAGRSLWAATIATALAFALGLPLAWQIARGRHPAWRWLRGLVALPIVMPPVVMGIALLSAFGRRGWLGEPLTAAGIEIAFTPIAPVVAATFVALPFFVLTVEGAIHGLDPALEDAAAVLGAAPRRIFLAVTLPALRPALVAGGALAWARALGEFGATMLFAGSLPGSTMTLPLLIHRQLHVDAALAVATSTAMLGVSAIVLALVAQQGGLSRVERSANHARGAATWGGRER